MSDSQEIKAGNEFFDSKFGAHFKITNKNESHLTIIWEDLGESQNPGHISVDELKTWLNSGRLLKKGAPSRAEIAYREGIKNLKIIARPKLRPRPVISSAQAREILKKLGENYE